LHSRLPSRILGAPTMAAALAILGASISLAQSPAQAQSLYKDPAGAFTVMVPAAWETQRESGSPMVSFVNRKLQASVSMGVIHGNDANTSTPEKELEMIQGQFPQNCPQAKIQKRGSATLGGIDGAFMLVNCTNDKGGQEVMKFAVASKPGLLMVLNSASPAMNYEAALPAFDSMEHSLKQLAMNGAQAQSAAAPPSPDAFHDPQGRYSLAVPDGWTAAPQADSGTLQLSSGPNWAMVIAGNGSVPSDVNQQVTQQIQAQFTGFQLLNEGDLQVNGHPSHGTTATGMNPKGERVSILVLSISAGAGHFLTVISSSPNDQAKTINATVMQMAQSIRFAGE
jgi:hypothetical protein